MGVRRGNSRPPAAVRQTLWTWALALAGRLPTADFDAIHTPYKAGRVTGVRACECALRLASASSGSSLEARR
ncbi:hypothetical protein C8Q79DRAFT_985644 [Trametes meyenii]|nr:hypothetical protein C8Q79DRAFT_985644 [Trametes meyenii]